MTRFPHKEKLYKCIREWQETFPSAFRLSEATKWLEGYFKREGGNMDTISVFIEFVKNLGLITVVEQNILASKYFFCDEKIDELFDDMNSNAGIPVLKNSWIRNGTRLTRQKTQPEFETQSKEFRTSRVFSTDLLACENWNHNDAQTWFEEIINRIACLLDTNHDELIAYLQSSGSNVTDAYSRSAPTVVCLGSAAHFNSSVLNHQRPSEARVLEHVIDAVCLACLDTLAQWPNEFAHKSKLCEGLCLPHRLLPTAMRFARCSAEHQLPKVVESLLELIFRIWPPADFSSTLQKLWTDGAYCSSNAAGTENSCPVPTPVNQAKSGCPSGSGIRGIKVRCNSDPSTPFLPPLATPLTGHGIPFVDDSQFFSCRPNRRPLFTKLPISELNDTSTGEYKPISPVVARHYDNQRENDVHIGAEDLLKDMDLDAAGDCGSAYPLENYQQPIDFIRRGIDELTLGLGSMELRSSDTSTKNGVSSVPRSTDSLPDQLFRSGKALHWSSSRSNDLILASQLALLFLPPFLYARLRVLVLALQRVLRNHPNLAAALTDVEDVHDHYTNGSSTVLDTFTKTLDVLARVSAPVLFNTTESTMMDSVLETHGGNWRELLARLMLCDSTGSLFQTPANLIKRSSSTAVYERTREASGASDSMRHFPPGTKFTQSALWCTTRSRSNLTWRANVQSPTVRLNTMDNENVVFNHSAIPLCVVSIVSASSRPRGSQMMVNSTNKPDPVITEKQLMASTPMPAHQLVSNSPPFRSYSTECFLTEFDLNQEINATLLDHAHPTQLSHPGRLNVSSMTGRWGASSYASDTMTGFDPQRLASLGNTAHLIKLLNQILNDREMEPRRKMKWLTDFRKAHPDVYWRRFGDQQTSAAYLERLQRRIDGQTQPSVLKRITNAFRRRQSRSRVRQQCSASESPPRSAPV